MRHVWASAVLAGSLLTLSGLLLVSQPVSAAELSAELEQALTTSRYAYIATERKSGDLGSPAEIWYMYHDGAVWVGTPKATYRARRIEAGRTKARVALGSRDGPTFDATGSIVNDAELTALLFERLAQKYPSGWQSFESGFRSGFADGSRVLIKYQPAD